MRVNRWDYLHVVDLNGDGSKDLIYSGRVLLTTKQ